MGEVTYPRTDGEATPAFSGPAVFPMPDGARIVMSAGGSWFRYAPRPRYGLGWQWVRVTCKVGARSRLGRETLRREGQRLERLGAPDPLTAALCAGTIPPGYREVPVPVVPGSSAGPSVPPTLLLPGDDEELVTWFTEALVTAELTATGWEPHLVPIPVGTLILCPGDVVRVEAEGPFHPWVWW